MWETLYLCWYLQVINRRCKKLPEISSLHLFAPPSLFFFFFVFLFFAFLLRLAHLESSPSSSVSGKMSTLCQVFPAFSQTRGNWERAIFLLNWSQRSPSPYSPPPPPNQMTKYTGRKPLQTGASGMGLAKHPHGGRPGLGDEGRTMMPEWWSQPGPATCCGPSGMEPGAFVLLEEPAERGWPRGFGPLRPQLTAH